MPVAKPKASADDLVITVEVGANARYDGLLADVPVHYRVYMPALKVIRRKLCPAPNGSHRAHNFELLVGCETHYVLSRTLLIFNNVHDCGRIIHSSFFRRQN